jgi:hypothetical protein
MKFLIIIFVIIYLTNGCTINNNQSTSESYQWLLKYNITPSDIPLPSIIRDKLACRSPNKKPSKPGQFPSLVSIYQKDKTERRNGILVVNLHTVLTTAWSVTEIHGRIIATVSGNVCAGSITLADQVCMAFAESQVKVYPTYNGDIFQDNIAVISLSFDFIQHAQLIPIRIEDWLDKKPGRPLALVDGVSPEQQFLTGTIGNFNRDLPSWLVISNVTGGSSLEFPRDVGSPLILTTVFDMGPKYNCYDFVRNEGYLYGLAVDADEDNRVLGHPVIHYKHFIMLHS